MKILYVAKHGSGGNQDEDAIAHALTTLGHEVIRIQEHKGGAATGESADFLLFHKWSGRMANKVIPWLKMKKVFWYFDLVDYQQDPTLRKRNLNRINWMGSTVPMVDLGFCTDGDWVRKDYSGGKLVRLLQGADGRFIGKQNSARDPIEILFTGISKGGGVKRIGFVDDMVTRYGDKFEHISSGSYQHSLGRRITRAKIVVAPDSPVTNYYWSNRVYTSLGFGAFMLHPYCKTLLSHYEDRKEIVYYKSRKELHKLIEYYLSRPEERERIAEAGMKRTLAEHTYKHRCEKLIQIVKERLF